MWSPKWSGNVETPKLSPGAFHLPWRCACHTRAQGAGFPSRVRSLLEHIQRVKGILQEFRAKPVSLAKLAEIKADILSVAHVLALAHWRADWNSSSMVLNDPRKGEARPSPSYPMQVSVNQDSSMSSEKL